MTLDLTDDEASALAKHLQQAIDEVRCPLAPRTSHRVLTKPGWPDYTFAFHDAEEIGPVMMVKIAKRTGTFTQRSFSTEAGMWAKRRSREAALE